MLIGVICGDWLELMFVGKIGVFIGVCWLCEWENFMLVKMNCYCFEFVIVLEVECEVKFFKMMVNDIIFESL